jgi:hypothetical protein
MTSRGSGFSLLVLAALAASSMAQDGVSSASASRARYLGNLGMIPSSKEIAVEEFVNYHRHEIGRPKAGEAVHLDVRWGTDTIGHGGKAILQVGLSTALVNDKAHLRPLNLSLVIDKSGSMAAGDKMSRVKASLLTLVSKLRESDVLSIVVFDSDASVLLPPQALEDKRRAMDLIRSIEPGSSTNIHGGLMLGYKQAAKQQRKGWTSRVVLLTDGIANVGVTEPAAIAKDSLKFNDEGIDLSTIGVGADLNKDLLRELAKSGRGLYHFVADAEDIEKVFIDELQSLISPIARDPNLTIEWDRELGLEKLYGYEPKLGDHKATLKLDNMNSGMTQVVLLKLAPLSSDSTRERFPVKVRLSYHDLERKKQVEKFEQVYLTVREHGSDRIEDSSVAKNYTIADLATALWGMAKACEGQRIHEAERVLSASIGRTRKQYPNLEDEDIKRTLTIAKKYQEALRKEVEARGIEDEPIESKGPNLILNGDFSLGNVGFESDLPYIAPSPNCLWGGYYTVASSFNSPHQLHTNVPRDAYAAPKGGQVLYMNSGGTHRFTVWSAEVKCKPRTKYRIRFREIGLSGGPEWTNSYEIRVGGSRSEAQLGGVFTFAQIEYVWDSGSSSSAKVSIVRLPHPRMGGVVGIANVEMVEVK